MIKTTSTHRLIANKPMMSGARNDTSYGVTSAVYTSASAVTASQLVR